jgi:uncharacterized surface protein with fasciclin (FAS1) repeats
MKHASLLLALVLVFGAGLALTACTQATSIPTEVVEPSPVAQPAVEQPTQAVSLATDDLLALLANEGTFTELTKLIGKAGLTDTLKGAGPMTLFAPTDAAFQALPAGTLDAMAPDELKNLLLGHILSTKVLSSDITSALGGALEQQSLNPVKMVKLSVDPNGNVTVDGIAKVTKADIEATNGVLYVIDAVILPTAAGAATEAPGEYTAVPAVSAETPTP